MSWSVRFESKIGSLQEDFENADKFFQTGNGEEECKVAAEKAFEAAVAISETVGHEGDEVTVTLGGHSNDGLLSREGWSKDYIQINISRK